MWWMLAACGGVHAPAGWDAVVEIKGDEVRFADERVGAWSARTTDLGPALASAVQGFAATKPTPAILLEIPTDATFADMQPLLDAVIRGGAGSLGIRENTSVVAGALTIPHGDPPSGDVTGADAYGYLYVHSHEGFWIEGRATFAPRIGQGTTFPRDVPPPVPVDCSKLFGKETPLAKACEEEQAEPAAPSEVVLGGALGCLVSMAQAADAPAWRTELTADVRSLDPRHEVIWSIVPDEDVPARLVIPILEGMGSAGARPPVLTIVAKAGDVLPPSECGGGVRDARGLDQGAARFVGAWSGPVTPKKDPPPDAPAPP